MQRKAPKKTQTDEERKQSCKTLWVGGVLCGSALAVASNLQQFGISFTTVGKAGFLTALYIVIVPILGLFLKKRVPATVWVSVVIAAAGTYLLSVQEGFTIAPGDLLVILCALGFSVHILIIDHFLADGERRGAFVRAVSCLRRSLHGSGAVYGDIHACGHFKKCRAAAFHGPDVERRGVHAANLGAEGYPACGGVPYHEP